MFRTSTSRDRGTSQLVMRCVHHQLRLAPHRWETDLEFVFKPDGHPGHVRLYFAGPPDANWQPPRFDHTVPTEPRSGRENFLPEALTWADTECGVSPRERSRGRCAARERPAGAPRGTWWPVLVAPRPAGRSPRLRAGAVRRGARGSGVVSCALPEDHRHGSGQPSTTFSRAAAQGSAGQARRTHG